MRLAGFLAAMLLVGNDALACASVSRPGEEVRIAAEEAVIIWDEKAKVQHFIRRADFSGKAKDFGFLVPTPSKPELAEADSEIFDDLRPPERAPAELVEAYRAASAGVTVLGKARLAGYEAVILEASDAASLDAWLKQHGYASSPELVEWYAPYVARGWKITAFKIDSASAERVSTAAVRMSFGTDEPFFPYREPKPAHRPASERLLRVFMVAPREMQAGRMETIRMETIHAGELDETRRARLAKLARLPEASLAEATWLTIMEDHSVVRGNADIHFRREGAGALIVYVLGAIILVVGVLVLAITTRSR